MIRPSMVNKSKNNPSLIIENAMEKQERKLTFKIFFSYKVLMPKLNIRTQKNHPNKLIFRHNFKTKF